MFEQVSRGKDLKTAVYERLRILLEKAELPAGALLGAGQLSSQLAVSRTPVREALLQLQEEGFVEIVPFRGARVLEVTEDYVRAVYEMRAALEGYAAWRAAEELQEDEMETLKRLAVLQANSRECEDDAWLEATEGLHCFLVERLKNDLLSKQFTQLLSHHTRIRRFAAALHARRDQAVAEHQEITAALLRRDSAAAYAAQTKHLMSVAADVIRTKANRAVGIGG